MAVEPPCQKTGKNREKTGEKRGKTGGKSDQAKIVQLLALLHAASQACQVAVVGGLAGTHGEVRQLYVAS